MSDQQRPFRFALGKFATGVTIVTTRDEKGIAVGVTASSFNSVSLSPPLILWSLGRDSANVKNFCTADGFNVHILGSHQSELSNAFARTGADKFAGLEVTDPAGAFPLLPDYAALFRCQTKYQYDGGDHIIFVGEVTSFESRDIEPLIYCGGKYLNARSNA
jgi:3-hydroxy-9,10-secoandrosta-1,3,5(10)-triene-9,17-dione monooxygenase reductase component